MKTVDLSFIERYKFDLEFLNIDIDILGNINFNIHLKDSRFLFNLNDPKTLIANSSRLIDRLNFEKVDKKYDNYGKFRAFMEIIAKKKKNIIIVDDKEIKKRIMTKNVSEEQFLGYKFLTEDHLLLAFLNVFAVYNIKTEKICYYEVEFKKKISRDSGLENFHIDLQTKELTFNYWSKGTLYRAEVNLEKIFKNIYKTEPEKEFIIEKIQEERNLKNGDRIISERVKNEIRKLKERKFDLNIICPCCL